MSDLSEVIDEDRRRRFSSRTARKTRKARHAERRGPSKPGGFAVACGCRFVRTGDAWRHVCPCREHLLGGPLSDEQMFFLLEEE